MSNYRDTSREAWKRFEVISGEIDRGIIDAIRTASASGITCEAIELQIGRKHQAVSGNLRHLVEKGLVKFSGEYGLTTSGRRAMKWILNMQPEPAKPEPSGAQLSLL